MAKSLTSIQRMATISRVLSTPNLEKSLAKFGITIDELAEIIALEGKEIRAAKTKGHTVNEARYRHFVDTMLKIIQWKEGQELSEKAATNLLSGGTQDVINRIKEHLKNE